MANFVYTKAKTKIANGTINFATADLRVFLAMTNTTVDTEEDVEFISGFTTLDEMDGANYARQALGGEAVNEDLVNDRAEADAVDTVFSSIGAGTRDIGSAVIYVHVTNDTDSYPVVHIDDIFPFTANGGDMTISWNAEGYLQFT